MNPSTSVLAARAIGQAGLVATVAGLGVGPPAVAAAPELPVLPFSARVGAVVSDGGVAGMRVSILQFRSELSADEVLAQSTRAWRADGPGKVIEATAGLWRTLSRHEGDTVTTLQVRAVLPSGSAGLLSVWRGAGDPVGRLRQAAVQLVPPGMQPGRITETRDGGKATVMMTSHSGSSPEPALAAIADHARRLGWTPSRPGAHRKTASGVEAVVFLKSRQSEAVVTGRSVSTGTDLLWMVSEGGT